MWLSSRSWCHCGADDSMRAVNALAWERDSVLLDILRAHWDYDALHHEEDAMYDEKMMFINWVVGWWLWTVASCVSVLAVWWRCSWKKMIGDDMAGTDSHWVGLRTKNILRRVDDGGMDVTRSAEIYFYGLRNQERRSCLEKFDLGCP